MLSIAAMANPNPSSREGKDDARTSRCSHCAGPLTKEMETSDWTVPPLIRDSFSMIGSAVGGTAGTFYGFNHAMPIVRKRIKGPMWIHFLIGAPTGHYFLIRVCRISWWFHSSTISTCIVVLSCLDVIFTISTIIIESENDRLGKFHHLVSDDT